MAKILKLLGPLNQRLTTTSPKYACFESNDVYFKEIVLTYHQFVAIEIDLFKNQIVAILINRYMIKVEIIPTLGNDLTIIMNIFTVDSYYDRSSLF